MATDETSESSETTTEQRSETPSAAKQTSAKKAPAKKSPAKKSSARKSPAKKSPSRADEARHDEQRSDDTQRSGNGAPRASAAKKKTPLSIASAAARQLLELTGKEPEGVTGLERTDDGWTVRVEVLELRRIPETTDVLALYEVDVDSDGDMTGYHRVRRYTRGVPGEE
jgi:hypothetical protein